VLKVAVAAVGALVVLAGPAAAAPPSGYDGQIQQSRGTGSDTTYFVSTKLADLYNSSPGCSLSSAAGFERQKCATTDPAGTILTENYDHDEIVNGFPTGSGGGIGQLCTAPPTGFLPVDFARSSRDPQGSDCTGLSFKGYAKDGLIPLAFPNVAASGTQGSPAAGCKPGEAAGSCTGTPLTTLTKTQLQDIFVNCSVTNWSQLVTGTSAPIEKFGVQTSSGTYLAWSNFLGGDPNSCVSGNHILFENNAQQIAAFGTAVQANALHWMSFGRYTSTPFTRANGTKLAINGIGAVPATISSGSFPATRFLYTVYKTASASQATLGFSDWVCDNVDGNHAADPETGKNFNQEATAAVNNIGGFVRPATCTTSTT
jgi:ABC-type phosphate transport system substrate-binding protein